MPFLANNPTIFGMPHRQLTKEETDLYGQKSCHIFFSVVYSNTEFMNDNFVYFIIRTPNHFDKYESDNEISFRISGMLEQSHVFSNQYANVIQSALNLI